MNLDLINRGVSPNDGTGDTLRDGAGKINDNFLKLLAAHASQSGNPVGGLQLTDILTGFRPDNPGDRTEGGVDFGVTAQALLAFIAGNMAGNQLNQLLRTVIGVRVLQSGAIDAPAETVPLTANWTDTGRCQITCQSGYRWVGAVAAGSNLITHRQVNVNIISATVLEASIQASDGTPLTVEFMLTGRLTPN